jgi:hypothetical protein
VKFANEETFNVAVELVDKNIERGFGEKTAIYTGQLFFFSVPTS